MAGFPGGYSGVVRNDGVACSLKSSCRKYRQGGLGMVQNGLKRKVKTKRDILSCF